jgi:S1-C subfamily serine protease
MADAAIEKAIAQGPSSGNALSDTAQKLAMEASLLGGGVVQGAWAKTKEFADHPIENTLTVAATAAGTWGLGYAAMRFIPRVMPAAKYVLAAAALVETVPGLIDSGEAVVKTWHNPTTYKQNKDLVADKLGKPLFDLALYSAAGAGGFLKGRVDGKLATEIAGSLELQATRKSTATHIPFLIDGPGEGALAASEASIKQIRLGKNPLLADVYAKTAPSIVHLLHKLPGGKGSLATGFIVDDGLIATDNHVLYGRVPTMVKLNSGETVEAKLVARDKDADLALLQLPKGTLTAKPLELGTTTGLESNSQLYMVGHPRNVSIPVASSGKLNGIYGMKFLQNQSGLPDTHPNTEKFFEWINQRGARGLAEVFPPEEPARVIRREVLSHTIAAQPGNSGSPIVDAAGKVVGIHSVGGEFKWATGVDHLKALIEAYKAEQTPAGWLKVITHAAPKSTLSDSRFGRGFERIITSSVDVLNIKKIGPRLPTLASTDAI